MIFNVISVVALILSSMSLIIGIVALIMIVAFKNSTHKIEWRAINDNEAQSAKEMQKILDAELEEVNYDLI